MTRVETSGLFHYELCGENETAAAAELENLYWDNWMRFGFPDEDSRVEIINNLAKTHGVKIEWVVG